MNQTIVGFRKAAALGAIEGAVKGIGSIGKQIMGQGVKARTSTRMLKRTLVGAGVGAGGSMLQQKLRGEDVDPGRAVVGGVLGAGVGAAAGTTAGARALRRFSSPKTTPNMTFREAANPMKWFQRSKDVGTGKLMTPGRTAFGNLSPMDKGMLGLNAYQGVKTMTDPEQAGRRGENIGGIAGSTGAVLTQSRWGRNLGGGSLFKSVGLFMGADYAGRQVGKRFDKKPPEVPVAQ